MTKIEEMSGTLGAGPERWLGRPLLLNYLDPPPESVEVRGGRVVWTVRWDKKGRRRRRVSEGLLDSFLKLRDAHDRAIADFVSNWGPLRLCEAHWLPAEHAPIVEGRCDGLPTIERADDDGTGAYSECTEAYRLYSAVAFQLLWVEHNLRAGVQLTSRDWPDLFRWPNFIPLPGWRKSPSADEQKKLFPGRFSPRGRLATWVDGWLWVADVRPFLFAHAPSRSSESGVFEIEFAGGSRVFGAIGLQLVAALTGSTGLVICAECGQPFFARKHPVNRNHYCDRCGTPAAHRRASQKYYAMHKDDILRRRKGRRGLNAKDGEK